MSVVLSLIDFNETNLINNYLHEFIEKMRNYRKPIPFSMKFEEVHQIIIPDDRIVYPFDTKISYTHNCICVSDETISTICFFSLETFEFINSFKLKDNLRYILIEENFDGIYVGGCDHAAKYRITDLLKDDNSNTTPIWKSRESTVTGMSIRCNTGKQKQLYVFNSDKIRMEIMDPMNGKLVGYFEMQNVSTVLDIIFITPTKMILSELDARLSNNKCFIFEEVSENNWKLIKEIEQADNVMISQTFGMTMDRVGKRIFLGDYGNKRLVSFDCDGNILATFSPEKEMEPYGMCFDDRTGLIYVTVWNCVRVFK